MRHVVALSQLLRDNTQIYTTIDNTSHIASERTMKEKEIHSFCLQDADPQLSADLRPVETSDPTTPNSEFQPQGSAVCLLS